jgi:quinol monooxygenase YgiN
MILATVKMTTPPQKIGEVLKILRSVAEECRDHPGCLGCHIYEDLEEKGVLILEEVWTAQEFLDRHFRSKEYLNLLLTLEMSVKKPEVRFDTISDSKGMEVIEQARNQDR